ncbi:MAG: RNase adapter RapZ [Clostridiales bacterium]|nr:MAG: RNase adapter RapZ [Clostridiales bacterium]
MELFVITGMSGAGKSTVLDAFEDNGYYCIDNLPPSLLDEFIRLHSENEDKRDIAVVMDLRLGIFFKEVIDKIKSLKEKGFSIKTIFVEADDDVVSRRFKTVRRGHPFENGDISIKQAILNEKKELKKIRKFADWIIDTSGLNSYDLKSSIHSRFINKSKKFEIFISSFGIKYGFIDSADYIFDTRFLPNPFYVPELSEKTGHDKQVRDFVMSSEVAKNFFDALKSLVDIVVNEHKESGKNKLQIAFYCTGGRHRSVTLALLLKDYLVDKGFDVIYRDRDIDIQ